MVTNSLFENAYNILNPEQKKAVDTIDGPVMVVAGPGTGKTQILTLRIANILQKTDTEPEQILALTFTEAAVQNMRKRLSQLIGSDAYSVVINTFHGFAHDIIKNNPEDFPMIVGSESITEVAQITILQEVILETDLDILKPFGDTFFYVRALKSAISELKREGVTPENFSQIIKDEQKNFSQINDLYHEKGAHAGKMKGKYQTLEKQIKKNAELSIVYDLYQKKLREKKQYDFDDMIMETLQALHRNPDLLLRLQEEHQYILVDEHQDTNNAQNKILELLVSFHDNPNLFVVGDEKQSIFRFQGASLENFFYFKHLYPNATLITLQQNYRSTQSILDSAHQVLAGEKELQSQKNHGEVISLYPCQNRDEELYFVATDIQKKITDGVEPHEIAVLYRNNTDAFPLADMLQKVGVPLVIESDQDLLSDPWAKKLIRLLRAVYDFGNDETLANFLHLDIFHLDPLDIFQVIRSASQKRKFSLFDMLKDAKMLEEAGVSDIGTFTELYVNLASWVKQSKNMSLTELLEEVVRSSGFLQHILASENPVAGLDVLETCMNEARSLQANTRNADLSDFFNYLDTVQEHRLFIKKKKTQSGIGHIRLMTAHRSKGLEFEHVYIIHAQSGKWGNIRRPELLPLLPAIYHLIEDKAKKDVIDFVPDKNDDERRLFYVALTRAKESVTLSYAQYTDDGKEILPSQFINEIQEDFIQKRDTEHLTERYQKERGILLQKTSPKKDMPISPTLVRELFLKQGLSVSALNNYLKSPWQYFYRNLMRIPAAPNKFQAYGIAVHAVLADTFKMLNAGENITKESFLDMFDVYLQKQQLLEQEYQELQDKGHDVLGVWFDAYADTWGMRTMNEFRINGVYLDDEIRLTGVLDKLEFITDTQVNVVDYKTGKPKTRNALMGNTKNDSGDYYRQLVFYKLLLNKFKDGKFNMVSGEIDFIEPDSKGKLHKEKFEIPDEDVRDLEETIRRVAGEIMNLKFWDMTCDPETCDYGDLVKSLKGEN